MITIKTNTLEINAKINGKFARMDQAGLRAYTDAVDHLRSETVRDIRAKRFGIGQGTGRLWQSLATKVTKNGDKVTAIMGTSVPYAAAHEFGATIRPVNHRYLTIPFPGIKGRAREYANTFFANSRAGTLILFQKTGATIRPLFSLVTSVRLPKREWMSKSFHAAKGRMVEIIRASIQEALAS